MQSSIFMYWFANFRKLWLKSLEWNFQGRNSRFACKFPILGRTNFQFHELSSLIKSLLAEFCLYNLKVMLLNIKLLIHDLNCAIWHEK